MKRACIVHDWVNLVLVPILSAMTVLGVSGLIDPSYITYSFIVYVVSDAIWVFLQPEAVPSLPTFILIHHAVTCVLLCVPLRRPHLHWYTSLLGLVELNTFFLIARRQFHSRTTRTVFSWLYWVSFLPLRMILYPALVPFFWREMTTTEAAPWWETVLCVGSMSILCIFNVVLLALSVMNWHKRRVRASSAQDKAAQEKALLEKAGAAVVDGNEFGGIDGNGTNAGSTRRMRQRGNNAAAVTAGGEEWEAIKGGAATPAVALKARAL